MRLFWQDPVRAWKRGGERLWQLPPTVPEAVQRQVHCGEVEMCRWGASFLLCGNNSGPVRGEEVVESFDQRLLDFVEGPMCLGVRHLRPGGVVPEANRTRAPQGLLATEWSTRRTR